MPLLESRAEVRATGVPPPPPPPPLWSRARKGSRSPRFLVARETVTHVALFLSRVSGATGGRWSLLPTPRQGQGRPTAFPGRPQEKRGRKRRGGGTAEKCPVARLADACEGEQASLVPDCFGGAEQSVVRAFLFLLRLRARAFCFFMAFARGSTTRV